MALRCVLWDFGDTLADERWMAQAPPGVPQWTEVWARVAGDELADRWNRGEVALAEVVAAVSALLPMDEEAVRSHVRWCCSNLRLFELPLRLVRRSRLPQALVTVNPDGFSDLVLPHYGLRGIFGTIVTSWEERTLDKAELAEVARRRLGADIPRAEALLIDNKPECVEAWRRRGGRAYLFRGERQLERDLRGPLRDLAAACGWSPA